MLGSRSFRGSCTIPVTTQLLMPWMKRE
jgi:hypothetical protein